MVGFICDKTAIISLYVGFINNGSHGAMLLSKKVELVNQSKIFASNNNCRRPGEANVNIPCFLTMETVMKVDKDVRKRIERAAQH